MDLMEIISHQADMLRRESYSPQEDVILIVRGVSFLKWKADLEL